MRKKRQVVWDAQTHTRARDIIGTIPPSSSSSSPPTLSSSFTTKTHGQAKHARTLRHSSICGILSQRANNHNANTTPNTSITILRPDTAMLSLCLSLFPGCYSLLSLFSPLVAPPRHHPTRRYPSPERLSRVQVFVEGVKECAPRRGL